MIYQMGRKAQAIYEMGLLNDSDLRTMQLETLLNDGIKPWEWDYENYSGENEFMKGMFYQEDWQNHRTIDSMINDKQAATDRAEATKAAAAKR